MTRYDKKRGRSTGPQFVQLTHWLLNSQAWAALTTQERAIYIEVRRRFNGFNNGKIACSARDVASRCNINKDTAYRGLRRLEELGFIELVTPGGFTRKLRHATEWRLTTEVCDVTGARASKAFMQWKPEAAAKGKTRSEIEVEPVPSNRTETSLLPRKVA
jgi:Helix-turn-helix domain